MNLWERIRSSSLSLSVGTVSKCGSRGMAHIALINVVRMPIPITDSKMRVIAVAAGSPAQDPTWVGTHKGAAQVIDESRGKLSFSPKDVFHRRCDDPSKAVGASFGGGQKVSLHLLYLTPIFTMPLGSGNASAIRHQHRCLRKPTEQ
jgi:hypothetical protein